MELKTFWNEECSRYILIVQMKITVPYLQNVVKTTLMQYKNFKGVSCDHASAVELNMYLLTGISENYLFTNK